MGLGPDELDFIVKGPDNPQCRKSEFEKIQKLTGTPHTPVPVPDFLFEIEYSDPANAKFYETKGERDLIYAFHGSRLENFHSIIHNGLHCHLNKVGPEAADIGALTGWPELVRVGGRSTRVLPLQVWSIDQQHHLGACEMQNPWPARPESEPAF